MKPALAGLALLLAGCGLFDTAPPVQSGYVQGRSYDDPDDWTTREPVYRYECRYEYGYNEMTGKYELHNNCEDRVVGHKTVHHHDGPHWFLRVKADEDWEGKPNVQDVEVDQSTHDTFLPGMHWPDPR